MTAKGEGVSLDSVFRIPIREFLERIIEERDRLYDTRFRAGEIAVNAALAAQEKAVTAAFSASEKAIIKAEDAQREYNVRSNEFRGQLADQAQLLMSRTEALTMFNASSDKIEAMRLFFESRLETQRLAFEKINDNLTKELGNLREYRSESVGSKSTQRETMSYIIGAIGIAIAVVAITLKRGI